MDGEKPKSLSSVVKGDRSWLGLKRCGLDLLLWMI